MKSRIKPKLNLNPQLIGYGIKPDKKTPLTEIAAANNLEIKFVNSECSEKTIEEIILSKYIISEDNAPEHELLIMAGLKNTVIDKVLSQMKDKMVSIDLKCIATPINLHWKLNRLIDELQKEHNAMHKIPKY